MIRSMRIQNFRSFESLEAKDLGRINVVVGDNGAGKTALLEALYLACGNNPQNHIKLRTWRGLTPGNLVRFTAADVASGALWRDMFYNFREDLIISIEIKGTRTRTLSIERRERASHVPLSDFEASAPIVFKWKDAVGREQRSVPRMTRQGLEFPNTPAGISGAMLAGPISPDEVAEQFSELDKRNRGQSILVGLRAQFPEIESLSVQVDQSAGQMLYASVSYFPEKIPLALISSGINRIVQILIAIEHFPGGTVLVDEIENGIYFTRLTKIWETIADSSKERQTQLFVSTHSGEALAALRPLVEKDVSSFRLLRVSKDKEGRSRLRVVSGDDLAAALEERVEVR